MIARKLGEAREKAYIGRNINQINKNKLWQKN